MHHISIVLGKLFLQKIIIISGDKFWNEHPELLVSLKDLKRKKKEEHKLKHNDVKKIKIRETEHNVMAS